MNNYFSHDSNARNDEKLIALRMKHGWQGYGLYWAIVEKLREASDYSLSADYRLIAFDLNTDVAVVESIVTDYHLFVVEAECFYSQSLCQRMKMKDIKREQTRKAALVRWEVNKSQSKKSKKRKPAKSTLFQAPSVDEVKTYCQERSNNVDAIRFVDFYAAKDWMIGKNKMIDWRSAVRAWERGNTKKANNNEQATTNASVRIHPALQ